MTARVLSLRTIHPLRTIPATRAKTGPLFFLDAPPLPV
jgi:hypothetical protein